MKENNLARMNLSAKLIFEFNKNKLVFKNHTFIVPVEFNMFIRSGSFLKYNKILNTGTLSHFTGIH